MFWKDIWRSRFDMTNEELDVLRFGSARPLEVKALINSANIASVPIAPGDTVVVMCPRAISNDQATRMKEMLVGQFPDNQVLVFGDGITLGVLSKTGETKKDRDQ